MGKHYDQLGLEERIEIYRHWKSGLSVRHIGRLIGRAASTISRELRRNSKKTKAWPGGYCAVRAEELAGRRRRWDARFKLARQPDLRHHVRDRLAMGWSPEQIAGRLALEGSDLTVSHESIYRYVYHRSDQKDYWHRLLPRAKSRRGRLGQRGGSPVDHIKERIPISARPAPANVRHEEGHSEADLMLFARYGQAVLVAHERLSRFVWLSRQPNKTAKATARSLITLLSDIPAALRRSMTFDNGTEFAQHTRLRKDLSMDTYFCDPHAPLQKAGVENAIRRIRRRLPRKTDLATLSNAKLKRIIDAYNATPRKCLGYKTPKEVFYSLSENVALQP